MQAVRTPDERFTDLPDWSFDSQYAQVSADGDGVRMAYVDEGPRDGRVALLMHGEPSWSYLYRHMIPVLLAAGTAASHPISWGSVVPTNPAARRLHIPASHHWMRGAVGALDLRISC